MTVAREERHAANDRGTHGILLAFRQYVDGDGATKIRHLNPTQAVERAALNPAATDVADALKLLRRLMWGATTALSRDHHQALSRSALAGLDLWRLFSTMTKISYAGYRFPPDIIQQAIWRYVRFTLSFRDVEDLLAEREIVVSYETVRRWVNHFGPKIAADLRKRRPRPHTTWHLDEVYLKIDGRLVYLWRAVGDVSEVLALQSEFAKSQMVAMQTQAKELGAVAQDVIVSATRK